MYVTICAGITVKAQWLIWLAHLCNFTCILWFLHFISFPKDIKEVSVVEVLKWFLSGFDVRKS